MTRCVKHQIIIWDWPFQRFLCLIQSSLAISQVSSWEHFLENQLATLSFVTRSTIAIFQKVPLGPTLVQSSCTDTHSNAPMSHIRRSLHASVIPHDCCKSEMWYCCDTAVAAHHSRKIHVLQQQCHSSQILLLQRITPNIPVLAKHRFDSAILAESLYLQWFAKVHTDG